MWLYVPNTSTSSPSAPEAADSISASSWQFKALEASVWWRGKPSQSRHWYQRWSKASFIQLLCGRMPEPSTAARGVAQWTASLVASRVSLTVLPARSEASTMSVTSGRTRAASSSSRAHGSSLSKTSPACSRRGMTKSLERNEYSETFQSLVSRLREDCSRRQKSARATSANASSSSAYWMTPRAGENDETVEAYQARRMRMDPAERMGVNGTLSIQAKEFQASAWPTPSARDWKGATDEKFGSNSRPLNEVAKIWATPTSLSFGDSHQPGNSRSYNINMEHAENIYSRLDLTTSTVGEAHSRPRRSLNPLFVEWLMGWPPGWTLLAWTDFACSATELSRFKQRMRSALLSLGLPREAPPAQLALFG